MKVSNPDILLTMCPPWGVLSPPLGLAYITESLENKKLRVEIIDLNIELYQRVSSSDRELWQTKEDDVWRNSDNVQKLLEKWAVAISELTDTLASSTVPIIGFSIVDPNEYFSAFVIRLLKKKSPNKIVIAGGPGCSDRGQREFLMDQSNSGIDYFVIGEGEETCADLVLCLKEGGVPEDIANVVISSRSLEYDSALVRPDLDTVAYPRFKPFDMSLYGRTSLAVMWSRGCIGRCLYCKERALWGTYRMRRVPLIIEELQYAVNTLKIRNFVVYDSAVNGNLKQLEQVCDEIIRLNLNISWSGEAIALKGMDKNLLAKMAKAGCHTLVYGIESGSDSVLSSMRKLSDTKTAAEVLRRTHEAQIKVAINILVGFPGETEADFQDTLKFLSKNQKNIDRLDGVSTLQIVSGTPLEKKYTDFGIVLPPVNSHDKWYIPGENDFDIRQKRLNAVLAIAKKFSFEVGRTFLADPMSEPVISRNDGYRPVPFQLPDECISLEDEHQLVVKARFFPKNQEASKGKNILIVACQGLPVSGLPATGGGIRAQQLGEALKECGHSILYCLPEDCVNEKEQEKHSFFRTPEDITEVISQTGAELVLFGNWGLACEAKNCDIPAIIDMNGSLVLENYYRNRNSLFKDSIAKIEAIAKTDFLIAGSKQQKSFLIGWALMAGMDPDQLSIGVVPYSLDAARQTIKNLSKLRFIIAGYDWPWLKGGGVIQDVCEVLTENGDSTLHVYTSSPPYSDLTHEDSRKDFSGDLVDQSFDGLVQHQPLDFDELTIEMEKATVAIDLWERNLERDLAFPSRTVAYLRAGLPVITSPRGALAELILEYEAGWLIESGDMLQLKLLIKKIVTGEVDLKKYQENAGRLFSEQLTREKTINDLDLFCKKPFFNRSVSPIVAKYNFTRELSLKLQETVKQGEGRLNLLEKENEIMGLIHRRSWGFALFQSRTLLKRKVGRLFPGLPILLYMTSLTIIGHFLHLMWIRRNKS